MKTLLTLLTSMLILSPTISTAETARFSKYYGILDLRMMNEREHDPNRDKTIIGQVLHLEIFENQDDCEKALISQKYAGNIWEIERTRNPFRDGELRLHRYTHEVTPDGWKKAIDYVRFCIQLLDTAK